MTRDHHLEFDALTHRALEAQADLTPDERREWQTRLEDAGFATRVAALERAVTALRSWPRATAPPGFATSVAQDIALQAVLLDVRKTAPDGFAHTISSEIALSHRLETGKVAAPPDFAQMIASEIALSMRLEPARMNAPHGFASSLGHEIALSHALETLPAPRMPEGFAANLATAINLEAELRDGQTTLGHSPEPQPELADPIEASLRGLERVRAPAGFAAALAARISSEARREPVSGLPTHTPTETGERNLTPFYFLAATLGSAALALTVFAWPFAQVAGSTALEIVRTVPSNLILTILAVIILAAFASSGRLRASLPASLAAFALSAAIALPQTVSYFGPARIEANQTRGTVVRVGGDLSVAGRITGDAISLGGSVRLEPGARVNGRIVTLLGDVNLPEQAAVQGGVNAVLGSTHVAGETTAESSNLPNLSAASALRPLRALVSANYWQWLYLGIVCALVAVIGLLPGWFEALEQPYLHGAGQSIGLGLLILSLSLPVGLLVALTLIGAPLGLGLLSLAAVAFTLGLSVSAVQLGHALRGLINLPRSAMLEGCLGLGVFALTLLYAPLAVAAWVLGAAWGAGALLIAWRSGRLDFVSKQLREEFAG